MDIQQHDISPSQEWQTQLNSTCNKFTTQYLMLLKSASGNIVGSSSSSSNKQSGNGSTSSSTNRSGASDTSTVTEGHRGGGIMSDRKEPPPALAADTSLINLQIKLASQNIAIGTTNMLNLIRQLRLSALLMDEHTIEEEERDEYLMCTEEAQLAAEESIQLEEELLNLWRNDNDELSQQVLKQQQQQH